MSTEPQTSAFVCHNIGQTDDGVKIETKRNTDGTFYFRASTRILSIFGSALCEGGAPTLEGLGATEAQARARLDKETRDFNDSLWA